MCSAVKWFYILQYLFLSVPSFCFFVFLTIMHPALCLNLTGCWVSVVIKSLSQYGVVIWERAHPHQFQPSHRHTDIVVGLKVGLFTAACINNIDLLLSLCQEVTCCQWNTQISFIHILQDCPLGHVALFAASLNAIEEVCVWWHWFKISLV